jgi:hypothetical protein
MTLLTPIKVTTKNIILLAIIPPSLFITYLKSKKLKTCENTKYKNNNLTEASMTTLSLLNTPNSALNINSLLDSFSSLPTLLRGPRFTATEE